MVRLTVCLNVCATHVPVNLPSHLEWPCSGHVLATTRHNEVCRGLEGYVILCSVSTFGSLGTTVLMLLLPASFWKRLETEKPWSIISNVAAGIGLTARVVWRTSVGRWTPRASANSAAIYPRQRRRSAYGNSSAGGRVAPECVEVEPTRAALAEAAPAGADTEAEGAGDTVPS